MIDNNYSVDVIIPVYNPDAEFRKVIELLKIQTYPINKIIIMNTEERYWNPMLERDNSVLEVHHVTKAEFDHGATRSEGASYSSADIIVFMTQDALPDNNYLIEELIKPFEPGFKTDVPVAASYARQLPNEECGVIERYTRSFNYPEASVVKSAKDVEKLGIKTFFCSNVCAAYKKEYFDKLGGFIKKTIFNEDMIFAGHAVKAGYAIAYQADARVIHSHNYTCMQQFHRNFDLGVSQTDHPEIFGKIKSETEGKKMVRQTIDHFRHIGKAHLIPGYIVMCGFRWMGYKLGRNYKKLPMGVVKACSLNKEYWKTRS